MGAKKCKTHYRFKCFDLKFSFCILKIYGNSQLDFELEKVDGCRTKYVHLEFHRKRIEEK